jgi:hypothetical protein
MLDFFHLEPFGIQVANVSKTLNKRRVYNFIHLFQSAASNENEINYDLLMAYSDGKYIAFQFNFVWTQRQF